MSAANGQYAESDSELDGAIAIVGMAGRFPGARNIDELRDNLLAGVESISHFTEDELRAAGVPDKKLRDPAYVRAAPILADAELFDADLFGVNPREAELLDPQFRVFLEICHSALQHAGLDASSFPGRIGIYAGSKSNTYLEDNIFANPRAVAASGYFMPVIGNHTDYLSTGVAYRLGLTGPAITSVTACSTSLVTVHSAVRALRGRECDAALAGGVELTCPQIEGYPYDEGGIYSPDGHVRTFDAKASGTVFGHGCAAVVLKRLADAIADRDTVHAVILGSSVNNDGNRKAAFSAPSKAGQVAVINSALSDAGIDPSTIEYVEAHGTATLVGDPIEVAALSEAIGTDRDRRGYCVISSVKPNVGHLGAAAGITGLINAVMSVRDGVLAPSINFAEPNPRINFDESPFTVSTATRTWERPAGPRRAAVNSFGIGGTNANLIIEQPPAPAAATEPARPYQLIAVSARTDTALDTMTTELSGFLASHDDPLAAVAHTLAKGRPLLRNRRYAVARTSTEAAERLSTSLPAHDARPRRPVFLFPGQGSQYPQMAGELYQTEPAFRDVIDEFARVLSSSHQIDLRALLTDADAATLERTEYTQPALFAVEYALAQLLRSAGLEPAALAGHSVGEYVAAALAGVFDPADALRLVADRGALIQSLPQAGSMMAVTLPEQMLPAFVPADLDIAAVNAPGICVVSGDSELISQLELELSSQGVGCRRLHTSFAFHSRLIEPVLDQFRARIADVAMRPPSIPFVSNLTGQWISRADAQDPEYWVRHARHCVRFSDTLRLLTADDDHVLLEVGPGRALTSLVAAHGRSIVSVPCMPHPDKPEPESAVLLEALGRAWASGAEVDWSKFWSGQQPGSVPLPAYPYERQRYWIDPDDDDGQQEAGADPAFAVPAWRETELVSAVAAEGAWLILSPAGPSPLPELASLAGQAGAFVAEASSGVGFADALDQVAARQPDRVTVVYGPAATSGDPGTDGDEQAQAWLEVGFYGLLRVLQQIARRLPGTPVHLVAVTTDMQDVAGDGQIVPAKAAVLGLVKTAPKELEAVSCRSIDLAGRTAPRVAARQLLAEITAGRDDVQVAYRGRKRWIWSYTELTVDDSPGLPDVLKEQGVYVISGGLGGLGPALAEHLARWVKARLVLFGRTGLPDRASWPDILRDEPADAPVVKRITAVQRIEEAGGEVLTSATDVTDAAQVARLKALAEERFGRVDGVFHLAGTVAGSMLETREPAAAAAVIDPKVRGAYVLGEVFDPDLMVIFSSIASVSGDFGLADYASANNVLDAYAQRRSAAGRPTVALCLPGFIGSGMADYAVQPEIFHELSGRGLLTATPVRHPMLRDRRDRPDGAASYSLELDPELWVYKEHRLSGIPLMPGTGVVELIRAACADLTGQQGAEISELVLAQPLLLTPGVAAALTLQPDPGGSLRVRLTGSDGREYVRATVRPLADQPAPRHDLDELQAGYEPAPFLEEAEDARVFPLTWGRRWDVIQSRVSGTDEELIGAVLPDEYAADLNDYLVHPAVLDACIALGQVIKETGDERQLLPFSYGKVTIRGPMPARVFSHLRHLDDTVGQTTSVDATIMDEHGKELLAIERYTLVRTAGNPAEALPDAEPSAGLPSGPGEPSPDGLAGLSPGPGVPGAPAAPAGFRRLSNNELATVAEGMDAVRALLRVAGMPQLIWSPEGMGARLRRVAQLNRKLITERLTAASGATGDGQRSVDTPYAAPRNELEASLEDMWTDTLGVDRAGIDDDFFDLGGNSLFAVQLVSRISATLGVKATVAALFESRTIRQLAVAMAELLDQAKLPQAAELAVPR
jgi:acyl transferase domain-containing protein